MARQSVANRTVGVSVANGISCFTAGNVATVVIASSADISGIAAGGVGTLGRVPSSSTPPTAVTAAHINSTGATAGRVVVDSAGNVSYNPATARATVGTTACITYVTGNN